jgi:DNA-directed RNA polymerase specialized sigma subunit
MPRNLERYNAYQKRYKEKLAQERQERKLMTFREIGERLGISEAYATKLYNQAIAKMKRAEGVI